VTLASLVPERDLPADAGPRERARLAVEYVRKSSMQLSSKMRYVSAQLTALLEGDLGSRLAAHANAMARELA
ncbi:threonine aldolase, partial [Micrococcus endophyticus]